MSKHVEKLKKQLLDISEVVNSFKSEAVQVKIIDKLFDAMNESDRPETDELIRKNRKNDNGGYRYAQGRKKPGATKILNQLISSEFFVNPRSISSIADFCRENYESEFKTSELSGILLKLAKENKLRRERNNINNRFEYVRTA